MNRRRFLIVGGAVVAAAVVGGGLWYWYNLPKGEEQVTISLYTWEEEIYPDEPIVINGEQFDTIPAAFEYLNPNIKVDASYYGDQDKMVAELLGGKKADVIAPCLDYIPVLLEHDLIEPINTSLMSNWNKMFPIFHERGVKYNGEVYFIPTNYGTEAIDYLRPAFQQNGLKEPTSWYDFFHPEELGFDKLDNPKKILMPDDAKMAISMAALALGIDLDKDKDNKWELDDSELQEVKQLLINQKPYVLKYSEEIDSEMPTLMANGDIYMSLGWAPETLELQDEGYDVVYVLPKEGALVFLCGNAIVKGTQYPEAAHKLIDFYLSEYVQKQVFAEQYWYGITNEEVVNQLKSEDPDLVEGLMLDKPQEALAIGVFEYPLDEGEETRWDQIWNEVLEA